MTPTQASTVLTASGYIVARSKAEISPKTVGRIAWLNIEEGQKVKKGELVARLESQELEAQKRQYVAARDQVVAQLENARLDRDRAKALLDEKIGSQQAFDAADAQVRSLAAQAASAEQQMKYTDELIKNAEIYSPIDGVVTVKKAFLGETVAPQGFGGAGSAGATFAVIVDLSSLEMEADINEQNVAKLTIGQPAEVALDAYPDKPYKGAPPPDRPDRRPAEGLREGQDRDPRQGLEGPARDVLPRRLPEPRGESRREGEAEGHGARRVRRRGRRREGRPRRRERQGRSSGLSSSAPRPERRSRSTSGVSGGEEIVADAASATHAWHREQNVRLKKD